MLDTYMLTIAVSDSGLLGLWYDDITDDGSTALSGTSAGVCCVEGIHDLEP